MRLRQLSVGDWARTAIRGEYNRYSIFIMFQHMVMHDLMHALASCLAVGFFRHTVWNRDE